MTPPDSATRMNVEAAQAAQAVRDQLFGNAEEMERLGVLTSSAALSVSSIYGARPVLAGSVCLAISQSGASPDLLASVRHARASGALVVAFVNARGSPLAALADHTVPLCAGPETSVAATKSFIASLAALIHLVASWTRDRTLYDALRKAPRQLEQAWQLDWSAAIEPLRSATDLYVVGRGLGLGVAQEAALKLKETCGLHAEAVSAAELRHGPMALVKTGFPVLIFSQNDEARASIEMLAMELIAREAAVMIAGSRCVQALQLPVEPAHPMIEPMLLIETFYRLANALSLARGLDPDHPPHLRKVTETV